MHKTKPKTDFKDVTLVVLTAGKATRLEPLSFTLPKGLLSLGGQPAINLMITPLVKRGLKSAVFVVSPQNIKLVESFIKKSYPYLDSQFVIQAEPKGPLNAFRCALPHIKQSVLLLYGDTLCNTEFNADSSFFGVHTQANAPDKSFGLINADKTKRIIKVNHAATPKEKHINTIIGIYFFKNSKILLEALNEDYPEYDYEHDIYGAQQFYVDREPTHMQNFPDWFDSGTLDTYYKAVEHFQKVQSRRKINARTQKIFKSSSQNTPNITENTDYLTLSEYYAFYPIRTSNFSTIFNKLIAAKYAVFRPKSLCEDAFSADVITGCFCRCFTNSLVKYDNYVVHSTHLLPHKKLKKVLEDKLNKLTKNSCKFYAHLHGNLNFSNILYSPRTNDFRFINSVYSLPCLGDSRWDFAALYASANLGLAEIETGMFEIGKSALKTVARKPDKSGVSKGRISNPAENIKDSSKRIYNKISYSLFTLPNPASEHFNKLLVSEGFDIDEIKLLAYLYMLLLAGSQNNPDKKFIMQAIALEGLTQHFNNALQ